MYVYMYVCMYVLRYVNMYVCMYVSVKTKTWLHQLVLVVVFRVDTALATLLEDMVDTVVLDCRQGTGVAAFTIG